MATGAGETTSSNPVPNVSPTPNPGGCQREGPASNPGHAAYDLATDESDSSNLYPNLNQTKDVPVSKGGKGLQHKEFIPVPGPSLASQSRATSATLTDTAPAADPGSATGRLQALEVENSIEACSGDVLPGDMVTTPADPRRVTDSGGVLGCPEPGRVA